MAVLMLAGRISLDPYRSLHEAKTGMRIVILYALLNSWPEICSFEWDLWKAEQQVRMRGGSGPASSFSGKRIHLLDFDARMAAIPIHLFLIHLTHSAHIAYSSTALNLWLRFRWFKQLIFPFRISSLVVHQRLVAVFRPNCN
jgi:hypothetical protein